MYIKELADELLTIEFDFIIEAEFNNNSTGLKLNDRRFSSTGTPRADFKKGIITSMPFCKLTVFDMLYTDIDRRKSYFKIRTNNILFKYFNMNKVRTVNFKGPMSLEQAKEFARGIISQGGEGAFAFHETHIIKDKGRSNLAIKLKADNSKVGICTGAVLSETVENEYGALLLDFEDGTKGSFGGLTNLVRTSPLSKLLGREFEVRYESFTNGKYIQGFINDNRL